MSCLLTCAGLILIINFVKDTSSSTTGPVSPQEKHRIVKTIPPLAPLDQEKRYVQPHLAHVSVFTGLFAWALRQERLGNRANRKFTLHSRTFGPDGLQAPTQQAKTRATFSNYFVFGTQKDYRPMESGAPLNVHRNRILFLALLIGIVAYTLIWISG